MKIDAKHKNNFCRLVMKLLNKHFIMRKKLLRTKCQAVVIFKNEIFNELCATQHGRIDVNYTTLGG